MEPRSSRRRELLDTWQYLIETHARLDATLGAIIRDELGLSMSSVEVLLRLRNTEKQQRPATRLAREVSFTSGGFTKLIDRLAATGLIERRADPSDRRVVLVGLTEYGQNVARRCGDILASELDERLLLAWKPEQLREVRDALLGLRDSLDPNPIPESKYAIEAGAGQSA